MKFDAACATNWNEKNPNVAHIHTGDASSEDDLARVVAETGSSHDFDVIMDDASHINRYRVMVSRPGYHTPSNYSKSHLTQREINLRIPFFDML